jgi:putative restriction endonuclease
MRYWWVNQNQTFRQEQAGGYLWSPKRKANGGRNHFYDTMKLVTPGDLVLSFEGQQIRAVGVVASYGYESPKPDEFGQTGDYWERIGWRVDVRWTLLPRQIRPADHMDQLGPLLPGKYSPLRPTGEGLQGVYLTEVPAAMMHVITNLVGPELHALVDTEPPPLPARIGERPEAAEKLKEQWENHLEQQIQEDKRIRETVRIALVRSRRGQGLFRDEVRKIEHACRITHVDNPEHLIASHCRPWRHSTNEERLDGENGLLLTPSIDHLFDRGFISFEDDGRLLVSPVADAVSLARMGVPTDERVLVGDFTSGQRKYLDFHRNDVFLAEAQR